MNFNEVVEMNNVVRDDYSGRIAQDSPIVEIFSRMVMGKEIGEIKDSNGHRVDINEATDWIKNRAAQAKAGNRDAMVELNEIRRYVVWPMIQRRLEMLNIFGRYQNVPYNTSIVVEPITYAGELSRSQSNRGDVVFGVSQRDAYTVKPFSVAAGHIVDYRLTAGLQMEVENELVNRIVTDMWNRFSATVLMNIYNTLINYDGVKFIAQGAGITQTALDDIIKAIRRFGPVSIFGDYSVTSQLGGFVGYAGMTPVYGAASGTAPVQVQGISQKLVTEFLETGLIANYKGASVTTLENPYNLSARTTKPDGTPTYETMGPEGFLFIAPVGMQSPVQTWTVGGLTTLTGTDIQTGSYMTRFDLAGATDVHRNRIMELGLIVDTSYALPSYMQNP